MSVSQRISEPVQTREISGALDAAVTGTADELVAGIASAPF
jgi:hypothetical protein